MRADSRRSEEPSGLRPYVGHSEPVGRARIPDREPQTSGVRPYLITGGRVGPIDATLRIEAQVLVTGEGMASRERLSYERRDIVTMCMQPLAVAELAAQLGLHLGVARVLVGDLIAMGLLAVRHPESGGSQIHLMERVIRGLQAIS